VFATATLLPVTVPRASADRSPLSCGTTTFRLLRSRNRPTVVIGRLACRLASVGWTPTLGAMDRREPADAAPPSVSTKPPAAAVSVGDLERFRAGHPDGIRAVYRAYGSLVFAVAMRTLGSRELAEEASQQTFVNAWRAAPTFDIDREPGPWLATIARRCAIDVHRREARRATTNLDDVSAAHPELVDLPPGVEQSYEIWEVRAAIAELPPDEREVVRLQHLEQLSHAEVAEQLDVPLGTVKSRSHRAHRRLAARLGHLHDHRPEEAP